MLNICFLKASEKIRNRNINLGISYVGFDKKVNQVGGKYMLFYHGTNLIGKLNKLMGNTYAYTFRQNW